MKRRKIVLLAAAGLFLLLFLGKFVADLAAPEPAPQYGGDFGLVNQSAEPSVSIKKNYASERIQVGGTQGGGQVFDQKYERISDIVARSSAFEADATRLHAIATAANAVVQRENAGGLPGNRSLVLALGVVPEAFDRTVESLRGVGKLVSIQVTKTDKTGEYRELEAKRLSLEKARDALRALRRPAAALGDMVALETKILEMEGQIQELAVSLGDFSEGSSFCTINFTLSERTPGRIGPRAVLAAGLDALGWAALVEAGLAFCALAALACLALAIWIAAKLKGMGQSGEKSPNRMGDS